MKDLNEIRETEEGMMLLAALAVITTECRTDKTPYQVLNELEVLKIKMCFKQDATIVLKLNTYYKITSKHDEETIVYYYKNPDFYMNPKEPMEEGKDYSEVGFGFNIADGGGFVPKLQMTYKHISEY